MSDFHKLLVKDVIRETNDCITIVFELDDKIKDEFNFIPGQYLTLKTDLEGQDIRRAYSISSGRNEGDLCVSVKRVEGGRMSSYLNDTLKKGDTLEVMKPEGRFTLITQIDKQRDHYFFAAGSGITPVMSMIQSMLEGEPKSTAYLLYGSKDENNIIFKDKLDTLMHKYEGQLIVEHTLSKPLKEKSKGLMGMLGKKTARWDGQKGRIDSEKVARFVQTYTSKSESSEFYICGPGDMIEMVQTTLMGNGVDKNQIHQEYFTSGSDNSTEVVGAVAGSTLKAHLNGEEITVAIKDGKTLLDTLLDAGHEAPYSCTSGACSSCMAKVMKGTVKMEVCYALDDDEVKQGYILTCQSHPTSNHVEIHYE